MPDIQPNPASQPPTTLTAPAPSAPSTAPGAKPAAVQGKPVPGTPQATEPPKEEPKVSAKLQVLVQREKRALEREKTAKTREEQLSAREETLKAREAKLTEFENIKKTSPRKALELLGMSYQDLTMAELNDGQVTPDVEVRNLRGEIDQVRKSFEDRDKAAAESAKQAAERQEQLAIQEHQREIDGFIGQNAKKYELIQFEGQQKLIFQVISAHYDRTIDKETGLGKIMTIEEAADKVEAFLSERYEKALSLEKFKSRVVPAKPPAPEQKTIPGQKPQAKTLNNGMSGNAGAPRAGILTDEQRKQKAIAYANGLRAAR